MFFIIGLSISYLYFTVIKSEEAEEVTITDPVELDSDKEDTHLSKVADTDGVYWQRMFDIFWNNVEPKEGNFNWDDIDEKMNMCSENNIYPLAMIKPFANWDQDSCHGEEYEAEFDPKKGGEIKVGKPCDMEAYKEFLAKVVERYDGDGRNDMQGLKIPIKYWEIMNEPSMQGGSSGGMGEELKFFVGTSGEYNEILQASYETIKEADPNAKVVQGGMAGMQSEFQEFWTPVLEAGGGDYFDIANMHTINTDENREDLYMIKFNEYLEEFGLEDKPIWITEVQYGELTEEPEDLSEMEVTMVKSTVFSLAQGADKLFYIENWFYWGEDPSGSKTNIEEKKALSTHQVYLNLVDKISDFEEVTTLEEEYYDNDGEWNGVTSSSGVYKFDKGDYAIYVMWGDSSIPSELRGQVKVTDIYGEYEIVYTGNIVLDENPIFIESVD